MTMRRLVFLAWVIASVALLMGPRSVTWAYSLASQRWTSSPIALQLQLDTSPPARTLLDGSTAWWQVAEVALSEWNAAIADVQFSSVRNSTAALGAPNGFNNVFFGSTVYGDSWGSGVLAVTITYTSGLRRVESDVVFKASLPWDSYRGNLRAATDFKRVALHEFGHVLGLDHPDEAGQAVTALMNSTVSNLDGLVADDLSGAQAAYGIPGGARLPTISSITGNQSVMLGSTALFTVSASGTPPLSYQWRRNGISVAGATGSTLTFSAVQLSDAGSYSVVVTNPAGSVTGGPSLLTVTVPPPTLVAQPASRTVVAGASVSFSVSASGFGVLSYQWSRNGVALPGATFPTLTLDTVQVSQAGDYTATVTNAGGSVTSSAARLTVQAPPTLPVIATPPTGQSMAVGWHGHAVGGGQWRGDVELCLAEKRFSRARCHGGHLDDPECTSRRLGHVYGRGEQCRGLGDQCARDRGRLDLTDSAGRGDASRGGRRAAWRARFAQRGCQRDGSAGVCVAPRGGADSGCDRGRALDRVGTGKRCRQLHGDCVQWRRERDHGSRYAQR